MRKLHFYFKISLGFLVTSRCGNPSSPSFSALRVFHHPKNPLILVSDSLNSTPFQYFPYPFFERIHFAVHLIYFFPSLCAFSCSTRCCFCLFIFSRSIFIPSVYVCFIKSQNTTMESSNSSPSFSIWLLTYFRLLLVF